MLQILTEMHIERNNLMHRSQKGARRKCWGTMINLFIDSVVTKHYADSRKSICYTWIDVAKAYDSISHEFIKRAFEIHQIPKEITQRVMLLVKGWKTRIETRDMNNKMQRGQEVKIRSGIFQGDGFCPLIFCMCVNVVSMYQSLMQGITINCPNTLEQEEIGKSTKITREERKKQQKKKLEYIEKGKKESDYRLTHLLYIDDNKQYSTPDNHTEEVLKTERAFRDIGLLYNGKKSAYAKVVKGKLVEDNNITLSTGQTIPSLKENEYYKYLGIYQNVIMSEEETWKKNEFIYMQRVWVIWSSAASGYNKIRAMNTFANMKLLYIMWTLKIEITKIRETDKKVRKVMRDRGAMAPGSCKALLYLDRKEGGRGLVSIEDLYIQTKIKLAIIIMNNENEDIKKIRTLEQGRRVKNLIDETKEIAAKIGLVLAQNEKEKWGVRKLNSNKEILIRDNDGIGDLIYEQQQQQYREYIAKSEMAGRYYREFRSIDNWSRESYVWLTQWKGISVTTERKMFEALEQLTNTKYRRQQIYKDQSVDNDRCRLCNQNKETVRHVLSNCNELAKNSYITRHNNALKVLYWWVLHKYGLEEKVKEWSDREEPTPTRRIERAIVQWNVKILSNEYTKHNKPDMLIIDHKKKRIRVVEASFPWDENINAKFEEKNKKYQTVRQELRKQYEGYELQQVNVIMGEMGTITTLREELAKISKKATKLVAKIQRVVIMHSIGIIENVFKRE